jgi:hypothetical protein
MAAFAVRHLTRPVGGGYCGKSENKNTQHDKGLRQKKGVSRSHILFLLKLMLLIFIIARDGCKR